MKLIRLPEVLDRVGLKKTAVYKLMAEESFPRPTKLGAASAWVEDEVESWIRAQMSARPAMSSKLTSS